MEMLWEYDLAYFVGSKAEVSQLTLTTTSPRRHEVHKGHEESNIMRSAVQYTSHPISEDFYVKIDQEP